MLPAKRAAATSSGSGSGRRAISCRTSSGFTLVEVLLATLIVGTVLIAATGSLGASAQAREVLGSRPTTALTLANEIHTLALALPRSPGDGSPARSGAEVLVLDDLDGASFSPPIDARLGSLHSSTGWTQAVSVDPVALAAPAEVDAELEGAAMLLKLTVSVRQGEEAAGSFSWWINP